MENINVHDFLAVKLYTCITAKQNHTVESTRVPILATKKINVLQFSAAHP